MHLRPGANNVLEVQFAPHACACAVAEKNVVSVLDATRTSFTRCIVKDVFGVQIFRGAETILEVQPREDFNFVRHTRRPNALGVNVIGCLTAIECNIGIPRRIAFVCQLHEPLI
jgi:hypothetical protein